MQFSIKKLRGVVCKVFCLMSVHFVKPMLNQYQDTVIGIKAFSIKLFYDWGSVLLNSVILYRQKLLLGSSYLTG